MNWTSAIKPQYPRRFRVHPGWNIPESESLLKSGMSLTDEIRMDRSVISVVHTATPSDAKAYWKARTMQERLAALELTRQILNAYDPDTTRFQRVLEVTRCP